MITKEVNELTKEQLTNIDIISSILEHTDEKDRLGLIDELKAYAKEQQVLTQFNNNLKKLNGSISFGTQSSQGFILTTNQYGKPEATTTNFVTIIENDPKIRGRLFKDVFKGSLNKIDDDNKISGWTDTDDAKLRCYIEKEYGIHNIQKYEDAISLVFDNNPVHPVKRILEEREWDGKARIDTFLKDIMKCEDSIYTREVSRMIFYGGINRIYNPGCKFDYMPILIGKQGSAKSLIVSLLGLEEYFADIYTIDGKDGMELLHGKWICEMGELLAMCRVREVEAMKGFLTRTFDHYRPSYAKHSIDNPRTCIFIGTTNDDEFLTDKTGNRRYLPINVHSNGYEVYANKEKIKAHILECWREALYLMRKGETYLAIDPQYLSVVEKQQRRVVVEDPRESKILKYLVDKPIGYKVTVEEIYTKALGNISSKRTTAESRAIGRILTSMDILEKSSKSIKIDGVVCKVWVKVANHSNDDEDLD